MNKEKVVKKINISVVLYILTTIIFIIPSIVYMVKNKTVYDLYICLHISLDCLLLT